MSTFQARLHFLMTRTDFRLALALIVSLLAHLLPFVNDLLTAPAARPLPPPPPPPPMLTAQLAAPPLPQQVPLTLPEPRSPQPAKPKPPAPIRQAPTASEKRANWQEEIRKQFRQQDERGLFYPAEAITRGLEGEVLVLLILDESGQAVAARVEQSSGQAILDAAALRAARSLHALPASAPRESLIPVRFRLR